MKKIISLLLALIMLFATVGCSKDKGGSAEPTPSPESTDSENVSSSENIASDSESTDESTPSAATTTVTSAITSVLSGGVKVETRTKDTEAEEKTKIKPEFTLDGDTTVRDELKFGKYKLVWSDEFNGTSLDTKVWSVARAESTASDVRRTLDQIKFTGKSMLCTAKRIYDPLNSTVKFADAPMIETKHSMNYQYGYLEMRARLPYAQGTWPALWLVDDGTLSADINKNIGNFGPEIDVYEIFGSYDTAVPNIHKWGTTHTQCNIVRNVYKFEDITNLCDEFHTYGFLWTEDEMSMFIDGEKYQTFDLNYNYDGDEKTGMEGFHRWLQVIISPIIVNSELQPGDDNTENKADMGSSPSDFPFEAEFDWIRLYQIPGKGGILTAK